MDSEIKRLQALIESYEVKSSAASVVASAQKKQGSQKTYIGGSTYIHWGKKTCGSDSALVYSGECELVFL